MSNTTRTQGLVGRIEKHSPRLARALAAIGVVLVAVELVVVTRWITSPQFERVPVGANPRGQLEDDQARARRRTERAIGRIALLANAPSI